MTSPLAWCWLPYGCLRHRRQIVAEFVVDRRRWEHRRFTSVRLGGFWWEEIRDTPPPRELTDRPARKGNPELNLRHIPQCIATQRGLCECSGRRTQKGEIAVKRRAVIVLIHLCGGHHEERGGARIQSARELGQRQPQVNHWRSVGNPSAQRHPPCAVRCPHRSCSVTGLGIRVRELFVERNNLKMRDEHNELATLQLFRERVAEMRPEQGAGVDGQRTPTVSCICREVGLVATWSNANAWHTTGTVAKHAAMHSRSRPAFRRSSTYPTTPSSPRGCVGRRMRWQSKASSSSAVPQRLAPYTM